MHDSVSANSRILKPISLSHFIQEEFSFVKKCSNIFWGFHIIIPGMLMLLSAIKSQWSISNWEFWITLFQCLVYIRTYQTWSNFPNVKWTEIQYSQHKRWEIVEQTNVKTLCTMMVLTFFSWSKKHPFLFRFLSVCVQNIVWFRDLPLFR